MNAKYNAMARLQVVADKEPADKHELEKIGTAIEKAADRVFNSLGDYTFDSGVKADEDHPSVLEGYISIKGGVKPNMQSGMKNALKMFLREIDYKATNFDTIHDDFVFNVEPD